MRSPRTRLTLTLIVLTLLGTVTLIPSRPAVAACSGTGCHGKDPNVEGCAVSVQTGQTANVWGVMTVEVRKSTACGGVKWARASRDGFYTGGTFRVWLEDANGNLRSGTSYTGSSGSTQIYGNMWTGAVKACALVTPYSPNKVCTPLDV